LTYDDQSPWKASQNASEFCQLDDLQESIRSQLRQEDKFTIKISGFRYTVKDYDGKWLVFRRDLRDIGSNIKKSRGYSSSGNVIEIKVFTLDEANRQLCNNQNSYELFGSDPVKVVHDEIKVVMARRIGSTSPLNGEDNNDQ
jgi:hypothetical protein